MAEKRGVKGKWGWGLIILSCILFAAIFAVPFLPLAGTRKVILASVLAVSAEVTFWLGGLLVGRDLLRKYRSKLSWFRKKTKRE